MNSKSILNVCLKVMGMFYALSALNTLPSSISQIILTWDAWKPAAKGDPLEMMLNFKSAALASLFTPMIIFIISLVIIFKSEKISSFILKSEDSFSCIQLDHKKILCISIILFGLFSILSAIPSISSVLSKYLIMTDSIKLYDNKAKIELAYSALRALLYILAGAFLIRYSPSISKKVSALIHLDENET
jgi:hypothetical protein